jgi:hypothetical protein
VTSKNTDQSTEITGLPEGHELFEASPVLREGVIYVSASLAFWRGWISKDTARMYGVPEALEDWSWE